MRKKQNWTRGIEDENGSDLLQTTTKSNQNRINLYIQSKEKEINKKKKGKWNKI